MSNNPTEKKTTSVPWKHLVHFSIGLSVLFLVADLACKFRINAWLLNDIRGSVYPALAGSIASLLGFVMASAAILLTINLEEHLKWMAAGRVLQNVFKAFTNTIFCLSVAFALSFVCLAVDRDIQIESTVTEKEHHTAVDFNWDDKPIKVAKLILPKLCSDVLLATALVSFAFMMQTVKILRDLGCSQISEIESKTVSNIEKNAELPEVPGWKAKDT